MVASRGAAPPLTSIVETLVTLPLVSAARRHRLPAAAAARPARPARRRDRCGSASTSSSPGGRWSSRWSSWACRWSSEPRVPASSRSTRRFEQMAETLGPGRCACSSPSACRSRGAACWPARCSAFRAPLASSAPRSSLPAASPVRTRTLSLAMCGFLETGRDGDAMRLVAALAGHRSRSGLACLNRLVRRARDDDAGRLVGAAPRCAWRSGRAASRSTWRGKAAAGCSACSGRRARARRRCSRWRRACARPQTARIAVGDAVLRDTSAGIDVPIRERGSATCRRTRRCSRISASAATSPTARARGMRCRSSQSVAMLSIEPLIDREVADLSGGERQRAWLLRARWCRRRGCSLLDEPLSARRRSASPSHPRIAPATGSPWRACRRCTSRTTPATCRSPRITC